MNTCLAIVLASGLLATPSIGAPQSNEPPPSLERFLMTERSQERERKPVEIGGLSVKTVSVVGQHPLLVWPASDAALKADRDSIQRWLEAAGTSLGHGALAAVFESTEDQPNDLQQWTYRLEADGVPVFGFGVRLFWRGGKWEGLVNDVPGPVASIERPQEVPSDEAYYLGWPNGGGGYALELASAFEQAGERERRTVISGSQGTVTSITIAPAGPQAGIDPIDYEMTLWEIPAGTFPDQIDTDSQGRIWFSQPNDDVVTMFRPGNETFTSYFTEAGGTPDGLIVSRTDIVYSGLFGNGKLGALDPITFAHTSVSAPYPGASLAIPTETSLGTIIVTDHGGHVVEWDPSAQTWVRNLTTPTPSPHIVAGVEDENQVVWFTEYAAGQLARLDLISGAFTEIPIPGGGLPAFPAISGGKVWFSLWTQDKVGSYDPATSNFTFYDFGNNSELGGPLFTAPNGDVICGTRGSGLIAIYDAGSDSITSYPIPHPNPGLKDGLTVDADGEVWFTLTDADQIGRLIYPD